MKSCIACLAGLMMILGLTSLVSADPVGGPSGGTTRVLARGVNVHKVLYQGGEQADFAIAGDGDTDLNLIVRDANGNEICRTTGAGDRARATWYPRATGYYFITVVNEGGVWNQYAYRAY